MGWHDDRIIYHYIYYIYIYPINEMENIYPIYIYIPYISHIYPIYIPYIYIYISHIYPICIPYISHKWNGKYPRHLCNHDQWNHNVFDKDSLDLNGGIAEISGASVSAGCKTSARTILNKNRRAKGGMKLLLSLLFLGSVSKPLPLVNMENSHGIMDVHPTEKWWFSIGMLDHHRVYALNLSIFGFTTCVSSTFSIRGAVHSAIVANSGQAYCNISTIISSTVLGMWSLLREYTNTYKHSLGICGTLPSASQCYFCLS